MRPGAFSFRRRQLLMAVGATLGVAAPALQAQSYPAKPIRLVVPYPPGGGTDIVARLLAQKLSQSLGQQVVVENKPGASTIIGTDVVAKAAPDGYTLGLITDSHAINPSFFPKLPYDSVKDFVPVSQLVFVPLMMVVHPSLNVKTLREFIALAKSQPGRVNYASIGNGTPHHIAMEWLRSLAGIEIAHVPYKGVAPALTDLVSGQVQVMFTGTSSAAPYVKDGRLIPLAVSTAQRQPAFPNVPAVGEVLQDYDLVSWYGIVAPVGTPRDVVQRLSKEIASGLAQAEVKDRLAGLGVEGVPSSPEDFGAFMRAQASHLQKLVQLTGVKPD